MRRMVVQARSKKPGQQAADAVQIGELRPVHWPYLNLRLGMQSYGNPWKVTLVTTFRAITYIFNFVTIKMDQSEGQNLARACRFLSKSTTRPPLRVVSVKSSRTRFILCQCLDARMNGFIATGKSPRMTLTSRRY